MANEILDMIKGVIHEFIPNSRTILFGSRSRSDFQSDSDFDLLIISGEHYTPSEKIYLRTQVRLALLKKGIRSDILLNDNDEVAKKSSLPGHILKTIIREGVPL